MGGGRVRNLLYDGAAAATPPSHEKASSRILPRQRSTDTPSLAFHIPPPPSCRMQVFVFIRQEVARSTSTTPSTKTRTSPSQGGSPSVRGGGGDKEEPADGAEAELLEKREVVLSELPRLMELNKVGITALRGGVY